jgi:Rad3-related DNA helicase/DNA polymerase III epsilon subunit-like protein
MTVAPPATRGYVAFDLETTGLSPKLDRPLEVGAVRYDDELRRIDEMEVVVDPGMPIPLAVQRLTGIREADVRGAPSPEEGLAQLAEFCEAAALVTHGGAFDLAFCRAFLPEQFSNRLVFDTLDLARILLPSRASHSLPVLSRELSLDHSRPHRAGSDAVATGELFQLLSEEAGSLPPDTLAAVRSLAVQTDGPLAVFFERLAGRGGSAPPREVTPSPPPAPERRPPPRLEGMTLDRAVAALLGPDGPLASEATYEYRESQVQMAIAVAQALERGRRLMVEAGTGVGKSLAYAVPLALWASRTGKRAVIATNTVTLQEQLITHDLPAVMRLLPEPVSAVMLKGRNHYISLRRWSRWLAHPGPAAHGADLDAIRFKLKILVWLTQTKTGDRSELHLTGNELLLWQHVASDSNDCLGRECFNWQTHHCHMVAAREAASHAQIVVTNHAILLADSERQGQVLAPYSALVVDEAHHLEASATEQLGTAMSSIDLALVLERIPALGIPALSEALEGCRDAGLRLFGEVKGFVVERLGSEGNGTVSLTAGTRDEPRYAQVLRAGRHCVGALLRGAGALETAQSAAGAQQSLIDAGHGAAEELPLASVALAGLAHAVDRVVCRPEPDRVAWLELRSEQAELHDAPTSVAETLREHVFDRTDAAVLTSATLAVADSFDFIRSRLGVGDGADELLLPSPFDYLEQAICVLAGDVPPYDDAEHEGVMAALVQDIALRLGGRTLVLFTGYGPLKRVHQLIGSQLEPAGISLLGQGLDGTRRQILQSFLADPRSVLLGTSSFWEGVDLPGDALRCVVIDKLPFAVPTDPLVRARTERLIDPFGQYVLPLAVLRLKQGFGRLIRSRRDRGAVVLCDPRLDSRDYGPRFLAALPPASVVRQNARAVAETVQAFVDRGEVPVAVGQSLSWSSNDMEPA